jgi:hypothetical protein
MLDGYGSKSTNSDLAGFYLLLYIRQNAGLFRRRTNVNEMINLYSILYNLWQHWTTTELPPAIQVERERKRERESNVCRRLIERKHERQKGPCGSGLTASIIEGTLFLRNPAAPSVFPHANVSFYVSLSSRANTNVPILTRYKIPGRLNGYRAAIPVTATNEWVVVRQRDPERDI